MRRPGILLPLAIIALIVLGVGAFILADLRRTARDAEDMYAGLARGLDLIGGLQYETQEARRAMLYALTTKDANLQVRYADESRAADARVARLIDDQTRLLDAPAAANAARQLGRDWATYLTTRDEVLASILEGSVNDAVARDLRDGVPAFDRVRTDLLQIQQLFKDRAELRMADVSTSSSRSFLRLILLLAATQILAVFAAVVLQKNQMLRAVQQSEERLREVIESINEGMFVVGRDGRVNLWNSAAERMWGRPRDGVVGHPLAAAFPEVEATPLPRAIDEALLTGRVAPVVEFARSGDAADSIFEARVFPFGRGVTVFLDDVTARKHSEAELKQAKEDAESASRAKSKFLASMSHELRTPLNAIIGFSEILTDHLYGGLNERQDRYVQNILVSGRHLLRLINDILDLSKVEAGRVTLDLAPFDVGTALRDVHVIVKTLAIKKGIALSFDVTPDLPVVTADQAKFKQVMYNLLSNAIKFTKPDGAVTTKASIAEDASAGSILRVSVTDTGIGIKPDDQARIFGEFEQVDSSYGREQQGTGLGLALVRQLVTLHGGRVWVESDEGKGSTFTFAIPVKTGARREPPVTAAAAAPAAEPSAARLTVLVAEDDPHASELLTQYITSAGYTVRHAFDGEQAVAMAHEIRPAAITLDIMLPKKDGWKVLAELKSHPQTRSIPVVIVSITDDQQLGFGLGATDFLMKPVDKEDLSEVLERAVTASAGRIRTVLVIDDEADTVEFVGDLLRRHGIEVLKAYGGNDGVAMAVEHRPDAIILDLIMPGVTGFDVVRRLREDPHARQIPILILTAKDVTAEERAALNRHVQAITHKGGREELLRELARLERVWQHTP
ncbi:MAG TPA: response regulator [Vicinamibacterales bacterium]|nr:response regulator [Vicinamibacterales bacterium]